ncbi:hypothetical protein KJU82_004927 [Salmonella enterica]|nr:hypothetical protein [Salmonella enterica]
MDNTRTDNTSADNTAQPVPSSPATPSSLPAVTLFNLEQFEWRVHTGETEQACRELVFLLGELDRTYGQWSDRVRAYASGQRPDTLNRHLCARIAGGLPRCSPARGSASVIRVTCS